jgi:hypothetical protein
MSAPAGTSADPFSLFEDALWFALESYRPLADLVKVGNRLKLTGSKNNPYESSSSSGDMPELQIWASGAGVRGGQSAPRASDTRFWLQRYSVGVSTEQLRTNTPASINPLRWLIFKALARAESRLIAPGIPFCTNVEYGDFRDQMQDVNPTDQNREMRGWKGVMDVEAQFRWSLAELQA